MEKRKVVIIGSGPGGIAAAIEAAKLGAQVSIIEKKELGGICLNEGCIPTKSLINFGLELKKAKKFLGEIMQGLRPDFSDWLEAQKRKKSQVEYLKKNVELLLKNSGVKIINGQAIFKDAKTILIATAKENIEIKTDAVIIATGSSPKKLEIFDWNNPSIIDTTAGLDLETIPENIAIIGGGVSGLEFATMFNLFSANVTILEQEETLLPDFDQRITQEITSYLKAYGIKVICGRKIVSVRYGNNEQKLLLDDKQEILAKKIIVAAGRAPNSKNLGLENTGVEINKKGFILVDEKMETNVPGIYAVGDVCDRLFLANVATLEGEIAGKNAMGREVKIDYSVIPKVIWTNPEIATVGLSKKEADDLGIKNRIGRAYFRANPMAQIKTDTRGFTQIIIEEETGNILGGQIIGPDASNLIQIIAAKIAGDVYPHPALSETINEAIKDAERRIKDGK